MIENPIKGNSVDHLNYLLDKIMDGVPFSIIRIGDGEYFIVDGRQFETGDRWCHNGGRLTRDLDETIKQAVDLPNMYIGFPCQSCWGDGGLAWLQQKYQVPTARTTYANIFCNYNWPRVIEFLTTCQTPFYYLGSGTESTPPFNILDRYAIDEIAVNTWDSDAEILRESVSKWVSEKIENHEDNSMPCLFIFCAGPLAKIFATDACAKYPMHQFIDLGSALDYYLKPYHGKKPYTQPGTKYHSMICDFHGSH